MPKEWITDQTQIKAVYGMRTTTLFERVIQDGKEWLSNIHNNHAEHQLRKSQLRHEAIYDSIISLRATR